MLFGRLGLKRDSSCLQDSQRDGDEHVGGLEAAAVGEHVHACARVVDLRDLVAEKDVRALGQPVGDLGVALGEHAVVPREAETLVVLEEGDVGAWARPLVLEIGPGDERQAAAVIGVVALAGGEALFDRQHGRFLALLLLGGDEVEVVGHHLGHLGGLPAAEPATVLVVEGHRAVARRCHAGDVGADDRDGVPPGEPRDRVVLEAMDPRCSQVGRQAELVRGPDAAAGAFASLEDRDVVPVDGQVACRRQPGDAGADDQDLSRWSTHLFPGVPFRGSPGPARELLVTSGRASGG